MQTYQEQSDFFDSQRAALRAALNAGGPAAAVRYIDGFGDELERRVLYQFCRNELVQSSEWPKDFDACIAVVDAGIAELERQAASAADDETRARRLWGAQILSFNLAADLAECWPGDDAPRTAAQLERGLKAAQDCLGWCRQLGRGPAELSNAFWALGMHHLSLGDRFGARASWQEASDRAREAQLAEGRPTTLAEDADWSVLLTGGYLGLGCLAIGDADGAEMYAQAANALRAQLADAERNDDAQFCLDQLAEVKRRFIDPGWARG